VSSGNNSAQKVWVLRDGQPTPIAVSAASTDGRSTEVTSDELKPGMQVIVETVEPQK
jgi:hypothetical protein